MSKNSVLIKNLPYYINPKDCCKKDCCKKECQEIINKYLNMITTIQIPTINFDKIHIPKIPINLDGFIKPKPPQIPSVINNDCLCVLYKDTYQLYLKSIEDINSKINNIYNRELDIEIIVLLNSIGMDIIYC